MASLKEKVNLHTRKIQNKKYTMKISQRKEKKVKKENLEAESLMPFHSTPADMFLFST